jgi:hypothetical protein
MSQVAVADRETSRPIPSERAFFGVLALLFAASAAVTIVWCASMSAMGGMKMPGGWTMRPPWERKMMWCASSPRWGTESTPGIGIP